MPPRQPPPANTPLPLPLPRTAADLRTLLAAAVGVERTRGRAVVAAAVDTAQARVAACEAQVEESRAALVRSRGEWGGGGGRKSGGGKGGGGKTNKPGNEAPRAPPLPLPAQTSWTWRFQATAARPRPVQRTETGAGDCPPPPACTCALHPTPSYPSPHFHTAATASQAITCPLTTTATTAVATVARAPPPARAHAAAAAAALLAAALASCPHGVCGAPCDSAASSDASSVDGPPRGAPRGAPVAAVSFPPPLHCTCPLCMHDSVRGGLGAGAAPRVAGALVAAAVGDSDTADAAADVTLRLADGPVGPHAFQAAAEAALAGVTGGGEAAAATVFRAATLIFRLAPRLPAWMESGRDVVVDQHCDDPLAAGADGAAADRLGPCSGGAVAAVAAFRESETGGLVSTAPSVAAAVRGAAEAVLAALEAAAAVGLVG